MREWDAGLNCLDVGMCGRVVCFMVVLEVMALVERVDEDVQGVLDLVPGIGRAVELSAIICVIFIAAVIGAPNSRY